MNKRVLQRLGFGVLAGLCFGAVLTLTGLDFRATLRAIALVAAAAVGLLAFIEAIA